VVNRADLSVTALPGKNWIDPRFSPDGTAVAAVAAGELHVIELATNTDRALTTGATATLTHGVAEFVAQEEMDRREGYWWSPDSQSLVYQETDEAEVEVRHVADPLHPEVAPQTFRYPHAGSANAKVRLGVIQRTGGATTWIQWDREQFSYVARVTWRELGAPLTILVQRRSQQEQRLLAVDAGTGATQVLLTETDDTWLNLDRHTVFPRWMKGGRQFLWATEARGDWQVELRDASGQLVRELTPVGFGYRSLVGLDEKSGSIYLEASADPTETHLWKIALAGGAPVALTTARGNHSGQLSEEGGLMVHSFSLFDGSTGSEVLGADGKAIATLPSVAENPAELPRVELTRTKGGERSYYAALVRPHEFKSGKKYPVILSVYAGPHVTVTSASLRGYLADQWLADQGYVVVRLDGRGTPPARPRLAAQRLRQPDRHRAPRSGGGPAAIGRRVSRAGSCPRGRDRLVVRRLFFRHGNAPPARRVPGRRGRRPGGHLGELRHLLHRALHGPAADEPGGLPRQQRADVRGAAPEAAPVGSRTHRRQCVRAAHAPAGGRPLHEGKILRVHAYAGDAHGRLQRPGRAAAGAAAGSWSSSIAPLNRSANPIQGFRFFRFTRLPRSAPR
jgi:hypothetical protein